MKRDRLGEARAAYQAAQETTESVEEVAKAREAYLKLLESMAERSTRNTRVFWFIRRPNGDDGYGAACRRNDALTSELRMHSGTMAEIDASHEGYARASRVLGRLRPR